MSLELLAATTVTSVRLRDIRFPTSLTLDGSDARSPRPDYSMVYCELTATNTQHTGVGMSFSLGRGNELLLQAAQLLQREVVGLCLLDCWNDMASVWRRLCGSRDGQLLWVGVDKAVVHQAGACLVNAVWDLWSKIADLPLWRLVSTLPPEVLCSAVPLWDLEDELTKAEALELLEDRDAAAKIEKVLAAGVPAYTTATGWSGYGDDKVKGLIAAAKAKGFDSFKMKVGLGLDRDCERAALIRGEIGPEGTLMMDANSVWSVPTAISSMRVLAKFNVSWIEEPIHCDDILGHLAIQKEMDELGIAVAGGEQTVNRVMMKQYLSSGAYKVCQQDAVKCAGLNEWLAICLMAKKRGVPMAVHTGGVGLCQMGLHLGAIDLVRGGGERKGGLNKVEYITSLEEMFVEPVTVSGGCYRVSEGAGWGLDLKQNVLAMYEYPSGGFWKDKGGWFDEAGRPGVN